jgi:hypothetical protein
MGAALFVMLENVGGKGSPQHAPNAAGERTRSQQRFALPATIT